MAVYKITVHEKPENYLTVFKEKNNPGAAFEYAKELILDVWGNAFNIENNSISVKEQRS